MSFRLEDSQVHELGYTQFRAAELSDDGSWLAVEYSNGVGYRVPIDYVKAWYAEGPHEMCEHAAPTAAILDSKDVVDLHLGEGERYYITWDVVLMACEPSYVHFGGFTRYSKQKSAEWLRSHGPFIVPEA